MLTIGFVFQKVPEQLPDIRCRYRRKIAMGGGFSQMGQGLLVGVLIQIGEFPVAKLLQDTRQRLDMISSQCM